jgi:hypothetical protein
MVSPGAYSMQGPLVTKHRRIIQGLLLVILIIGGNWATNRVRDRMPDGFVYRSRLEFLGLPLVDMKFFNQAQLRDLERRGVIPGLKPLTARGWIAGGLCAVGGLVAFGVLTVAPIAVGVGAFGLCAVGTLAVGLVVGLGVCGLGGYLGVGVMGLGLVKSSSHGTSVWSSLHPPGPDPLGPPPTGTDRGAEGPRREGES